MDNNLDSVGATDQLARVLYDALEKADPSDEFVDWMDLLDRDRQVYISAVRAIIANRHLFEVAAGLRPKTT